MQIAKHDITPTTDIAGQLSDATIAERKIYIGGYYAASGTLDNGDTIEMWIVEERGSGCSNTASYVYLALNGVTNKRRYNLNGDTAEIADWLRGRHTGYPASPQYLGTTGQRIISNLYADVAPK